MNYPVDDYLSIIKNRLSDVRYIHSVNVSDTAEQLALKYGADPVSAKVAGLLHDIAKEDDPQTQLQTISNGGIILNDIEKNSPNLYHSVAGSVLAKLELGIPDEDILNAIRYHTSARSGMSKLEKIVYLADLTSADRSYETLPMVKKLAFENLDSAMLYSLRYILCDLVRRNLLICSDTVAAYNEYSQKALEANI